jgi:cell division septum initiation protein DivIVA
VSNARRNADQIVARAKAQAKAEAAQAKAQADQLIADTQTELERHRAAAQLEVDELTRQKDAITNSLEQLRRLITRHAPVTGAPAEAARPAAVE